jgi:glycerate 2-kinase
MTTLRDDAGAIWRAAIDAVQPQRLITERLAVDTGDQLLVDGKPLDPPAIVRPGRRLLVVGGGKAAAGMAAGLERVVPARVHLEGLVAVPAGCGLSLPRIEVRETRPAGSNQPTEACVTATQSMLERLRAAEADDVVIALVTGGGSAILEAPCDGIPLSEIVAVSRWLSERGGDITQLNAVRQMASGVKAGGLARACRASRLVTLVLSDVIGNPLATISSGPCMPVSIDPAAVLATLEAFGVPQAGIAVRIVAAVRRAAETTPIPSIPLPSGEACRHGRWTTASGCRVSHHLIGSNDTAVDAAADEAGRRGYRLCVRHAEATRSETANQVGGRLAEEGLAAAAASEAPLAIIEGGEATVQLPQDHGRGGRNQQTVAAGLARVVGQTSWPDRLLLASIGTDGEDGPTDTAGGCIDARVAAVLATRQPQLARAVARCDAEPLLAAAGGLVRTGPTGTNVADLRLVLIGS